MKGVTTAQKEVLRAAFLPPRDLPALADRVGGALGVTQAEALVWLFVTGPRRGLWQVYVEPSPRGPRVHVSVGGVPAAELRAAVREARGARGWWPNRDERPAAALLESVGILRVVEDPYTRYYTHPEGALEAFLEEVP